MYGTRVTTGGDLPGAVHAFADAGAVSDTHAVLGQGRGDSHIVDLLETTGALAFERARAGYKNDRRTFAPSLHHGRNSIGKALWSDKADRRLSGDAGMGIGQVAGHLFMRAIDDAHTAFHKAFQCWIAEPARKCKDVLHALFNQGPGQYGAATKRHVC